jgi:tRNA A37 threonylcarbamoyladenosine biosynthesis protein TsaE
MGQLTRLKDACERNITALKDCIRDSLAVIEWAKSRGEIPADEIVCAQTLVHYQYSSI